jgi:hypothetical protein
VAAHPDVLLLGAHEVREHVDHRLPVADEHVTRGGLQLPVAQQRDERRHEDEVGGARAADALHRGFRDLRGRVVEQRDEQPAEARLRDLPDRGGHVAPRSARVVAPVARQLEERVGVGEQRPRHRCGVLPVDRAQRGQRRGPDAGIPVADQPPDLRRPLLRDVAAHGAERAEGATPDRR